MAQITPKEITIKNEEKILIRAPEVSDAERLVEFVKQVSIDSEYLLLSKGEFSMTVEQEAQWIESNLNDDGAIILIGEIQGEIVAITNAKNGNRKRNAHVAHLGTSVSKKWRGKGIGKAMMRELCQWAKEHPLIEFLELSVMTDNKPARNLYESLGFETIAEVPKAYKYEDGNYQGNVIMSLKV